MTADTATTYLPARLGAHELVLLHGHRVAAVVLLASVGAAGHHLPRRAPDAVVDAMAAFLAATDEADNRVERRSLPVAGRVALRQPSVVPIRRRPPVLQTRARLRMTHHRPPAPGTRQHPGRVAADRLGYSSDPQPAAGFAANARAVLDLLNSRGIQHAALWIPRGYESPGSSSAPSPPPESSAWPAPTAVCSSAGPWPFPCPLP
jgi:hypothetical protein